MSGADRMQDAFVGMAGIMIVPTIAMQRGESYVTQCAYCGLLVCVAGKGVKLSRCPADHQEDRGWWRQRLPIGPFHEDDASDITEQCSSRRGRLQCCMTLADHAARPTEQHQATNAKGWQFWPLAIGGVQS